MSIFSQHAFGMPMFSAPSIPVIEPGRLGPHFDQRPTPPAFPGASVGGCSGCGGGLGALGADVNLADAAKYNAEQCADLGWRGNVIQVSDEPFLAWLPGRGSADCASSTLATAVIGYQTAKGLVVDGKLGPVTVRSLKVDAAGGGAVAKVKVAAADMLTGRQALVVGAVALIGGGLWLAFKK